MTPELTHYCIVRGDLPIGVVTAQLTHAAGETSQNKLGMRAVVLQAESEHHLVYLSCRLNQTCVHHKLVRDPDPPWDGAAMAIGVYPVQSDHKIGVLRKLKLYGGIDGTNRRETDESRHQPDLRRNSGV